MELELPGDAPRTGPLYLIGDGFLHPWDDTVTMARSQGHNPIQSSWYQERWGDRYKLKANQNENGKFENHKPDRARRAPSTGGPGP